MNIKELNEQLTKQLESELTNSDVWGELFTNDDNYLGTAILAYEECFEESDRLELIKYFVAHMADEDLYEEGVDDLYHACLRAHGGICLDYIQKKLNSICTPKELRSVLYLA